MTEMITVRVAYEGRATEDGRRIKVGALTLPAAAIIVTGPGWDNMIGAAYRFRRAQLKDGTTEILCDVPEDLVDGDRYSWASQIAIETSTVHGHDEWFEIEKGALIGLARIGKLDWPWKEQRG